MSHRIVTVLGAETYVRDEGSGPPVVLLHGNPDTSDLWDGVIEPLQEHYRCLAPDLPGFGRSAVPEGFDFALASMAAWLEELIAALGVDRPVRLVVHDFGGPFALAWAVEHAESVHQVAVCNSLFSSRLRWHFWARIWRTPVVGEISMLLMNRWLFAYELRRGSCGNLGRDHVRRAYQWVGRRSKRTVLRLYRATDPAVFRGWEERFVELARSVPVQVLWGSRDPYLSLDMAHAFGTNDVEFFEDNGHWLPAEAPVETARRLLAFFAQPVNL